MPGRRTDRIAPSRAGCWLAAGLAAALALPAVAQERPPTVRERPTATREQPAAARGTQAARGAVALLRGLDKITGTTTDLRLAPGEAARFGRLELRLGECRYPVDDPDSDAFAELTITDTAARHTVFAGWMIASSPALSALDDARYDVWVVSCQSASASGSSGESTAGSDSAAASRD